MVDGGLVLVWLEGGLLLGSVLALVVEAGHGTGYGYGYALAGGLAGYVHGRRGRGEPGGGKGRRGERRRRLIRPGPTRVVRPQSDRWTHAADIR